MSASASPLHRQQLPATASTNVPLPNGARRLVSWPSPLPATSAAASAGRGCVSRQTSATRAPSGNADVVVATADMYTPYHSARSLDMSDPQRRSGGNSLATTGAAAPAAPTAGQRSGVPPRGHTAPTSSPLQGSYGAAMPVSAVPVIPQLVGGQAYSSIQLWTPRAQKQPRQLNCQQAAAKHRELSVEQAQQGVGRSPTAAMSVSPRSFPNVSQPSHFHAGAHGPHSAPRAPRLAMRPA